MTERPFSLRRILTFLGINLTLGSLISLAANVIQLLTVTNGIVIFTSVFVISLLYFIRQVIIFQKGQQNLISKIQDNQQELQERLQRISMALKTRLLDGNPRPDVVVAWVSVKKLLAANISLQIREITDDSIILAIGGKDGLVSRIPCKIARKGGNTHLEESVIDWVDPDSHQSIIKHSGSNLHTGDNPVEYSIELIFPPVTPTEKFIGNIMLLTEGHEPDWG